MRYLDNVVNSLKSLAKPIEHLTPELMRQQYLARVEEASHMTIKEAEEHVGARIDNPQYVKGLRNVHGVPYTSAYRRLLSH